MKWLTGIYGKIIGTVLFLAIISLCVLWLWGERQFRDLYLQSLNDRLVRESLLLQNEFQRLQNEPLPSLNSKARHWASQLGCRITLIDPTGVVLADSEKNPAFMDNHHDRPEVLEALSHQTGQSERQSATLHEGMIYFARAIRSGDQIVGVVRVAYPSEIIHGDLRKMQNKGIVIAISMLLLIAIFASGMVLRLKSRVERIAAAAHQISSGSLDSRALDRTRDEVGEIARAVDRMGGELNRQATQAERERVTMNAILTGMSDGVLAFDGDNRILFMNPSARQSIEGLSVTDVGRSAHEVIRSAEILENIEKAQASGSAVERRITLFRNREERVFDVQWIPRSVDEGRGMLIVLHDVSELNRLENVRKDFVANASHELKTPLTVMKGYVETLLSAPDVDEKTRQHFLTQVAESVRRLDALTSDLLSLSRIESGQRTWNLERLQCNEVIRRVAARYATLAEKKSLSMDLRLSEDTPSILADRGALEEIVENLVGNALKYTEAGTISIVTGNEGDKVRLDVEDTGVGILPVDQSRIFERFYRVDKARSRELGSTGLGLSIVKHLVSEMGGSIELVSEYGKGSRFSVLFPVVI